jgi:hypothetical protein
LILTRRLSAHVGDEVVELDHDAALASGARPQDLRLDGGADRVFAQARVLRRLLDVEVLLRRGLLRLGQPGEHQLGHTLGQHLKGIANNLASRVYRRPDPSLALRRWYQTAAG